MRLLYRHAGIVTEPSAALGVAVMMAEGVGTGSFYGNAMALVTAAVERNVTTVAFSHDSIVFSARARRTAGQIRKIRTNILILLFISKRQ